MKAQNQGVLWVDRVRDRGSYAILAQISSGQYHRKAWGRSGGAHSLLAESFSERPGAVQGAPAGASEAALDGEDRSGRFPASREWPPFTAKLVSSSLFPQEDPS